jgi:hypothetical protein
MVGSRGKEEKHRRSLRMRRPTQEDGQELNMHTRTTRRNWTLQGWIAAACIATVGTLGAFPQQSWAQSDKDKSKDTTKDASKDTKVETLDQLIFRNGNKVEGKILAETETTLTMKVVFQGISSETVYQKAEILEIKRGAIKVTPKKDADKDKDKDADNTDEKKAEDAAKGGDADENKIVDKDGKAIPAGNLKVYYVPLYGEFGRDLSFVSLEDIIEDMKLRQPDLVVFKFDFAFSAQGRELQDFAQRGFAEAWNSLETATDMAEVLFRKLESSEFPKKPRTAAWINRALGGAAFLPCAFPEIYFTKSGLQGGIGGLEVLAAGVGDEVAQEKQRSLRLARAKGLAELGGHDSRFVEAMTRRDYWLSYKIEGGKAVLKEDRPDSAEWTLLKDDGKDERADSPTDYLRMQTNDYLNFNATNAQTLGWSRGTADTLDDLLFKMGIDRNFSVLKTKAEKIMKGRSKALTEAEQSLRDLAVKFNNVRLRDPGGYKERTAYRGQRMAILKQAIALLKRYDRDLTRQTVRFQYGDPEVLLKDIELEQRNDRP